MKLFKFLKGKHLKWISERESDHLKSRELINTIDPNHFPDSLKSPTDYYLRAFQDFHRLLPKELRDHRTYFGINRRGFGEDAFHTMWWRLFRQFRPKSFLEIGVYQGQVISLIALLSQQEGIDCKITGISPFTSVGDSVSKYRRDLDYHFDTLSHFEHFRLIKPNLVQAYSTDEKALEVIASHKWDMIYIDGNHDYEIVAKDWDACSKAVNIGGLVILDDSGLGTSYRPPSFATGGHPGPSRLAAEIDSSVFQEILQVGHNRVFKRKA
jgi:hypothetical protein